MFCPKCGQSQVSADVRFCSRCGFPLVVVGDVLLTGGVLPVRAVGDTHAGPQPISPRRRGVKQGVALLLVSIFLLPFFGILHEGIGLPGEFMVLSAIVAMAAILRLIYATFFEEGWPSAPQFAPPTQLYTPPLPVSAPRLSHAAQEMLPSAQQQQGTPVNSYRQSHVDTAEIMHPPSVTDHTTRLLDKQQPDSAER